MLWSRFGKRAGSGEREKMQPSGAKIRMRARAKERLVTLDCLDGRTRATRRVRQLMAGLQKQLGRKPTQLESMLLQRVAVLSALAEDARVRLLRRDPAITYDAVVRADNAARRALRDFAAAVGSKKEEPWPC